MKALVPLIITEPFSREMLERGVRTVINNLPEEAKEPALDFYSGYMGPENQRVVNHLACEYLLSEFVHKRR